MTPVESSDRRRVFCARIKNERERRGTSIADIAASTKIKGSLLDALERGDLSRWPKGIYRRAFFRDYVAAIGLEPDSHINEFLDVFAENDEARPSAPAMVAEPVSFRLLYEDEDGATSTLTARRERSPKLRALGAAIDIALIAAFSGIAMWTTTVPFMAVALPLAVLCIIATAWLAHGPSEWLLARQRRRPATAAPMVQTFNPSSLPYNAYAPSRGAGTQVHVGITTRGLALIREYFDRLSDAPTLTFNSQRRRELETSRRRRVEAANQPAADEMTVT
jgi:hypothetical protein